MRKLFTLAFNFIQKTADNAFEKADNHRLKIDNNLSSTGDDYLHTNEYTSLIYHIECNMALCRLCDLICKLRPQWL